MRVVAVLLFLIATTQAVANQAPNRCASAAAAATADALAAKFDQHQFIFIGSTHGDRKIEEFLMCLVSRPAFQEHATDIVTEWASSGQQRLLDRYVLTLETIAADDLVPIWLDTDHPRMWATLPQVRQFVETLRDVNKTLPSAKPFFVDAKRFPTTIPWPPSLKVGFHERSTNLADYIDAFVYLGPEPDKDMTGSIPLTASQQRELERRNSITSDPQRTMRARYQGRDQWFRAHPNDFPPRPN